MRIRTSPSPVPATKPGAVTTPSTSQVESAGPLFPDFVETRQPDLSLVSRQLATLNGLAGPAKHSLTVDGKPMVVQGSTPEGAQAIAREFAELVAMDYQRGLPVSLDGQSEVFVLSDADYVATMGHLAEDYEARFVSDGQSYHLVVRESVVTRSQIDGTAVREALLPAMAHARPYMANVAAGPLKQVLVRGSFLTPETLRAASDVDAFSLIINTRGEDPGGRAEARLVDRENQRRAKLGKAPIEYIHVPIKDFNVPDAEQERRLVGLFREILSWKDGRQVYLHCKAGVGRTGTSEAMAEIMAGEVPQAAAGRHQDWFTQLGMRGEVSERQTEYILEFGERWRRGDFDAER